MGEWSGRGVGGCREEIFDADDSWVTHHHHLLDCLMSLLGDRDFTAC